MARIKKMFVVSETNLDYIKKVKEEKNLKYDSESLDLIIREHRENEGLRKLDIIELIGEEFSSKIEPILKVLKYIENENNKDLQVMMELFNNIYWRENYKKLVSTKDEKHSCLVEAEELINERIENKRMKKLDKVYD